MQRKDMHPTDCIFPGAYQWCSHVANASEVVLATAIVPLPMAVQLPALASY